MTERLRFEQLLFDLSARFINIAPHRLDSEIEEALKRILEFFEVDRCGLIRIHPDNAVWQVTHVAYAPEVSSVPKSTDLPITMFPWTYKKTVERNEVVSFANRDKLPSEAAIDKQTCERLQIRSSLTIPICVGGEYYHLLAINAVRKEKEWPKDYVPRLRLLGEILIKAVQLAQFHQQLEERLRFERLISELSARFINIKPAEIKGEITKWLRSIAEFFDADRCSLGLFSEDETRLSLAFEYHREGVEPAPLDISKDQLSWYITQLTQGNAVMFNRLDELPPEAENERHLCLIKGMKSLISIPVMSMQKPLGSLALVSVRAERIWPPELVKRTRLITEVFANALEHSRSERALRKAELDYRTILDFTYDWEYWENLDGSIRYASPACERITGFSAQEFVSNPRKLREIIVAEDLELWNTHFQEKGTADRPVEIQFRIKRQDGVVRWIEHTCRRVADDRGRFLGNRATNRDITERKGMQDLLRERLRDIEQLKQQLEKENIYLRKEIELQNVHEEIVGRSPAMKQILVKVEQVAGMDTTVLIEGETGTGKELLARAVHRLSDRKDRGLVTVNCASLPPTLIESELFGREKGAYTGAMTRMTGRFEVADGATLFLDEIGELPHDMQAKLLRVLEEGRFERLGSNKSLQVDVRIIAATNRDLSRAISEGRFRKDLYYRLNVFPIIVPPLRERREDIPLLVWSFVRQYEKKMGKRIDHIPRKSMEALQSYSWPGNVRELRNVVEHAMIVTSGKTLEIDAPQRVFSEIPSDTCLEDAERRHILGVLEQTDWRLGGEGGAAEILGLRRTTLQSKMKKLGIQRRAK